MDFDAANAQYLPAKCRRCIPAVLICDANQGIFCPQKIDFVLVPSAYYHAAGST